jgi:Pectate lyase superfamily protein
MRRKILTGLFLLASSIWASADISVLDYGADPTGASDSTAAIQTACNVGGAVFFPRGNYHISQQINITLPGVYSGEGGATTITLVNPTVNGLAVNSANVTITDMSFNAIPQSQTGAFVSVAAKTQYFTIQRFYMTNYITGIYCENSYPVEICSGSFASGVVGRCCAIQILNGGPFIHNITVDMTQGPVSPQGGTGISISATPGKVACATIGDCQFIHAGNAIQAVAGPGAQIQALFVHDCLLDTCNAGVVLSANGGQILWSKFSNDWISSMQSAGVIMETSSGGFVRGTDFTNDTICNNRWIGILAQDSGVHSFSIQGCNIAFNQAAGVFIGRNVDDFKIQNSTIGWWSTFAGNGAGVIMAGGNEEFLVSGNDFTGNAAAGLVNPTPGFGIITGNISP